MLYHEGFEGWLRYGRSPDDVVGLAGHVGKCPVATWLSDVWGGVWGVSENTIYTPKNEKWRTPRWVCYFVRRIDARYKGQPVTAAAALEVLSDILEMLRYSSPTIVKLF